MICPPAPEFDTAPATTTAVPLALPLIPSVPHVAADLKAVPSRPAPLALPLTLPSLAPYAPVDLASPSIRCVVMPPFDSERLAATIRRLSCTMDVPAVGRKLNPTVKFPRIPALPESPRVVTRAREVDENGEDEDQEELAHLSKRRRSVSKLNKVAAASLPSPLWTDEDTVSVDAASTAESRALWPATANEGAQLFSDARDAAQV
ncbi:hypothetical protein AMAG_12905 [Allomyces macrogynus ATCC 38327]|uniref:Uncharacterized protein n=1 Tax=Allomyces macrogynus (strain ATCC 38327) TaxID=578462 RepID=A0A0L0T0X4_ALLM3|nr:hypothetical protein AMAG_12905 [Allomyces macrogynus ATCC 38327]|eukprot:KNE68229.1 hypothetical protein AMAG_12905 [Allomyces macrogynus ATCC 38327]